MRRTLLIAAAATVLAAPAPATAAEPESGTVSATSPSTAWTGTLVRPYLHHNVFFYEEPGTMPCTSPSCDTFTLEVADSADLAITVQSEQTSEMSLRIQKPDGSWQYFDGWSDAAAPTRATFKNAATGTYTINVVARVFGSTNPTAVDDTADYAGTAELKIAPPAVAAPPAAPAAPAGPQEPASDKPRKKRSKKAACRKKAKKIRKAKKRRAALKRCARKNRR